MKQTVGVFGLVGTVVADDKLRAAAWAIDAVGLIVATALLLTGVPREFAGWIRAVAIVRA